MTQPGRAVTDWGGMTFGLKEAMVYNLLVWDIIPQAIVFPLLFSMIQQMFSLKQLTHFASWLSVRTEIKQTEEAGANKAL